MKLKILTLMLTGTLMFSLGSCRLWGTTPKEPGANLVNTNIVTMTPATKTGITPSIFEIRIIDNETKQGIPGAFMRAHERTTFYTDNNGYIAFKEPYLFNTNVFYTVAAPGYTQMTLTFSATAGKSQIIQLNKKNPGGANLKYRLTGIDKYTASLEMGKSIPQAAFLEKKSSVLYPDSPYIINDSILQSLGTVPPIEFGNRIFWIFNATQGTAIKNQNRYITVAMSDKKVNPAEYIPLNYITDKDGDPVPILKMGGETDVVMAVAAMVVKDGDKDVLALYYQLLDNTYKVKEHGIATWNNSKNCFEKHEAFENVVTEWQRPYGNAMLHEADGKNYVYFGSPYLNVRVPATLSAICNPGEYEAYSCLKDGVAKLSEKGEIVNVDANGIPVYRWTKLTIPVSANDEADLIRRGLMKEANALYSTINAKATSTKVAISSGTIAFNKYRNKWILVGGIHHGANAVNNGTVWYSEADSINGPWKKVVKIADHDVFAHTTVFDAYTFLSPAQMPMYDMENGKKIYFQGTYSTRFNSKIYFPTEGYNHSRLVYEFDLSSPMAASVR